VAEWLEHLPKPLKDLDSRQLVCGIFLQHKTSLFTHQGKGIRLTVLSSELGKCERKEWSSSTTLFFGTS